VLNSLKEIKVKVQMSLKKKFDKLKQEKKEEEKSTNIQENVHVCFRPQMM